MKYITVFSEVKHNESKQLSLIGLIHLVPSNSDVVTGFATNDMQKIVVRIKRKGSFIFFIVDKFKVCANSFMYAIKNNESSDNQ
jgi:hypothetical protein